ncbi:MAG: hypothetical protein M3409_05650 [Gemmatimonadota bacterium]|jgi:hypothetical protein|nr:hypothetical protein [Gemmatimonadota bacterium]
MNHKTQFLSESLHPRTSAVVGAFGLLLFILGVRRLSSVHASSAEPPEIGHPEPMEQQLALAELPTANAA